MNKRYIPIFSNVSGIAKEKSELDYSGYEGYLLIFSHQF